MKSAEIRQKFLQFFADRGHEIVPSSSLVPGNDPTLLFTNAGMVQFKDAFLGDEIRAVNRATSSQRCVRAGGKHNDLENVGYTARHHTFFEMLGNFSFGDYFKRDAIKYAWEFLTVEMGLPAEKLWVTVYQDDDEAAALWLDEMKIDPTRFSRLGEKDNFWAMGDTGPCGPCSEIFYDHGEEVAGGPPGSPDEDGDRYIEIWNLVFMQYERKADGTLTPLPKPSVDTGAGLERVAAVMQNVHSNYEIDLFQALLADIGEITGQLGVKEVFFYKIVAGLVKVMGEAYPELKAKQTIVEKALRDEEQQFARTLENGMTILEKAIANLKGDTLAGETVFKLYDTYGFPVDLTADVARESNIMLDMEGFEAAMQVQREQARAAGNFSAVDKLELDGVEITDFRGYEALEATGDVAAIYVDGEPRDALKAGESATLVLTRSPFYGESGGQVGDSGTLFADGVEFRVDDTQKQNDVMLHIGELVIGSLKLGASLGAQVAANARKAITLNHSATHLMHSALRNTLGEHVTQKGSLVDAARLRFDFSHSAPMTADELATIEAAVNAEILANTAMALFGEKYGDEVRVVSMGGKFSVEFCGGTHVERTGDIGLFKIVGESGISSGVRRIEAVTGQGALALVAREEQTLKQLCDLVKANQEDLLDRVKQINASNKALEKELDQLKAKIASSAGSDLASSAKDVAGIKLLACAVDDFDPKALRETVDQLKNKLGSAVVLLISTAGGKVSIVAGVSKDLTDRVKAGELANMVATQVGGKGGGRPDMAMAGGSDVAAVPAAVESVEEWVASKL